MAVAALAAAVLALTGVLVGSLLKDHNGGTGHAGRPAAGAGTSAKASKPKRPPGAMPVSVDAQQVRGNFASSAGHGARSAKQRRAARARKRRLAARRRKAAKRSAAGARGATGHSGMNVAALGVSSGRAPAQGRTGERTQAHRRARVRSRAKRSPRRHRSRAPAVAAPAPRPPVAAPLLASPPAPRRFRHDGRHRGHGFGHRRHGDFERHDRGRHRGRS